MIVSSNWFYEKLDGCGHELQDIYDKSIFEINNAFIRVSNSSDVGEPEIYVDNSHENTVPEKSEYFCAQGHDTEDIGFWRLKYKA